MKHLEQKFELLLSVKLFILIVIFTLLFFHFIDLPLYEYSRSLNEVFFFFFQEIIDPFSDIVDPGNVIVICIFLWLMINQTRKILNEPKKIRILTEKLGFKKECIVESMRYYLLIIKHIISSILITGTILHILKYILGVARPKYFFLKGYERQDFFNFEHKVNSLPSGHTQAAFTIAILFILYFNRYNLIILTIACLLGLARIFMSAHFPSDIILGAYIGSFFPIIIYKLYFLDKFKDLDGEKIFDFRNFLKMLYLKILV
ncbi:phosphatase PAP2 family protein [Rickettsiales bacterium]|nr:phosphatase PAP2 family protein [Rickettsiales bacterium]